MFAFSFSQVLFCANFYVLELSEKLPGDIDLNWYLNVGNFERESHIHILVWLQLKDVIWFW